MTLKKILILCLASLTLSSCETVIELDFNDADPILVIEATLTNESGPYLVKLSESAAFYDDNIYPPRTDATVIISDNLGNSETLSELAPGSYLTEITQGSPGVTYTLSISTNGETFEASSTMPEEIIPIDGLQVDFEEESIFADEGYYVTAYLTDPPQEGNNYRLKFFRNGDPYIFLDDVDSTETVDTNLYLSNDKFFNGNQVDVDFDNVVQVGDTVTIEVNHLDLSTFDYYRTLSDAILGGGVAPSDPVSNFEDKALGYFGAYTVGRMSVIIEE
ncbi:MAG: hypothetical protein ACI86P_002141 [Flavobacteriales bacterium]|jgi:hypothetical protein